MRTAPEMQSKSGEGYVVTKHAVQARFVPRIERLKDLPAELSFLERMILQAHVLGFEPERCLEIGVFKGGSSKIIHEALSRGLEGGVLVSVDPDPRHEFDWEAELGDCATLLVGRSPEALAEAVKIAGGRFQFVFIDGDHSTRGIMRDLEGLVGVTEPGAHLMLHDAAHPPLAEGMRQALESGLPYFDAGPISVHHNEGLLNGEPTCFGGLQLLVRTG